MKFDFVENRPDHGGALTITAGTPEEKSRVISHFRLADGDPVAAANMILDPEPLIHTPPAGSRDNGAWFNITGAVELEFTAPYYKELRKRTGYEGRGILPDIPAGFFAPYLDQLAYTHYPKALWLEGGHLCYDTILTSSDWNKMEAAPRAELRAKELMNEKLGRVQREPEFIEMGNGHYKPNPSYLMRHSAKPALESQWFFGILVDWWLSHDATPQQRDLVTTSGEIMFANHRGISDLHSLRNYQGLRVAWDDKVRSPSRYTWEEFARVS